MLSLYMPQCIAGDTINTVDGFIFFHNSYRKSPFCGYWHSWIGFSTKTTIGTPQNLSQVHYASRIKDFRESSFDLNLWKVRLYRNMTKTPSSPSKPHPLQVKIWAGLCCRFSFFNVSSSSRKYLLTAIHFGFLWWPQKFSWVSGGYSTNPGCLFLKFWHHWLLGPELAANFTCVLFFFLALSISSAKFCKKVKKLIKENAN